MVLQPLKNTARVLERKVALRMTQIVTVIAPGLGRIGSRRFIPSREIAGRTIFRIAIIRPDQAGGVRVMNDVLAEEELIFNDVPNEPAKEGDIAPRANRDPNIGESARAREAWIDVDNGGPVFFRLHYPAKANWMGLGHGRAFDQDAIRARQILLRSRSSAPAERGAQTGHRAAMSYPGPVR